MKKTSFNKVEKKSQPVIKRSNMRLFQEDKEKNKFPDNDCIVEHQTQYIENLQQQIYALENELDYLRSSFQERNKQHPSIVAESERVVKKLADCQIEIKNMKIDLKRKQTSIDLLRSEKDRFQKTTDEAEERHRKEKCKLLEDLITLQNERDSLQDMNSKGEVLLLEQREETSTLQEDFDNLGVEMQQMERQKLQDKDIIQGLMEEKEKLQRTLLETQMKLEAKSVLISEQAAKELKGKMEQLYEEIEVLKRSCDQESMLRERLSQDNTNLIKRHAEIESELAGSKAALREEQSRLKSLEQVHLNTILNASETKGREISLKHEIEQLGLHLKEERERSYNLAHQLSDEQRFKAREEEKLNHLQERFIQREDKMKNLKTENIAFSRDNSYLKDQILHLKEQVESKDQEVLNLKYKVQDMQVSVEEFIQTNQTATKLAGERWKQLSQLAKSIQALTNFDSGDYGS